ncbi:MAG: hypothetical protein ACI8XC_001483 [Gammaproteobacteria bacterium]
MKRKRFDHRRFVAKHNLSTEHRMKRIIESILIIASLVLVASCGSSDSTDKNNVTSPAAVQLSGIIALGNSSAAPATSGQEKRFGSSPQNQIVVLAIDAIGNSFATTTDSSGQFLFKKSIGLQSNTAYAMIFIDMSSLEIIATLSNNANAAGMLTVPGDAEISEILVDTNVKLASIIGIINSGGEQVSLQLSAAGSLDSDSDGQISQGEIVNALVNTTQQGEIDTITSVSAFTFLGQPGTWTIGVDLEDDAFEASICDWIDKDDPAITVPDECTDEDDENHPQVVFLTNSAEMTVLTTARVEGPQGGLVNVAKLLELTFLNAPFVDEDSEFFSIVDANLVLDVGFVSGSQADINDQATVFGSSEGVAGEFWTPFLDDELGSSPTREYNPRMGLFGWSEYQFADAEAGKLITGSKNKDSEEGTFKVEWGDSSLPLNFPINTPFEFIETETNEEIDPSTGKIIQVETFTTSTVTVNLVVDNGNPALLEEGGGSTNVLPVFQIRYALTNEDEEDEVECSYIVTQFGVEGDDPDENCDDMSDWQSSFVNVRFGRIEATDGNVTVIDSTPTVVKSNDSGEGLPVDENGNLTAAAVDWLTYLYNNANVIDYQFESLQAEDGADFGTLAEFWAWVESPAVGSSLSPQPEPNAIDNTQTLLQMGQAPGAITVRKMHYHSNQSAVQFYLDLRIADPTTLEDESVLDEPVAIDTSVDTSTPTTTETVIDISATFAALPAADSEVWLQVWSSIEDPDGKGDQLYDTTQLTVWVIMDADGELVTVDDQYAFPVDRYKVTGAIVP